MLVAKNEERLIGRYFQRAGWEIFIVDWLDAGETDLRWVRAFSIENDEIVALPFADDAPTILLARSMGSIQQNRNEILSYLERLVSATDLHIVNHPAALRLGMNKQYLTVLANAGLPIIPSTFYPASLTMADIVANIGSRRDLVIKPVFGECGNLVSMINEIDDDHLERWKAFSGGWLIQPFNDEIRFGEWSLVFVGTECTSAVHKIPADGQFRVNSRWKPSYRPFKPTIDQVTLARKAMLALQVPHYLSRVDLVMYQGSWAVGEVEIVNPGFYYQCRHPDQQFDLTLTALDRLFSNLLGREPALKTGSTVEDDERDTSRFGDIG